MSGECERCSEHCLDCTCNPLNEDVVVIPSNHLIELIYWARRYCDNRSTYAPSSFNKIYKELRSLYPDLFRYKDKFDMTLKDKGVYWPYAQDGMYDEKKGIFDARK